MQKSSSTGIPLEFTNLKKYQFSGSWCVYTPKIHHARVSKTNSLRPTTLVALLHLQWRVVCALYFMVWLPLVDPNLVSLVQTPLRSQPSQIATVSRRYSTETPRGPGKLQGGWRTILHSCPKLADQVLGWGAAAVRRRRAVSTATA